MAIFTSAEDLKSFLGEEIIAGLEVTDAGVLAITWVQGQIFNVSGDIIVDIAAGGDNVADDDISYLVWDSANALELQLTTAAGNQVLVATIEASSGDIDTVTEHGFDFSNVSGLNGRPVIRLFGDKEVPFFKTYGQIIIDEENLIDLKSKFAFRDEEYRLITRFIYDGEGPAVLKNIIGEVDGVFRANNKLHQGLRDYLYFLKGSWNTNYRASNIRMLVDATKDMVVL